MSNTVPGSNVNAASIRRLLFGLSPEQTSFVRLGFRGADGEIRARLEKAAAAFVSGYHLALDCPAPELIGRELDALESDFRGFAFEGASMGLALFDVLTPWRRNRIQRFVQGSGNPHIYMVHVGVGWIWARVPIRFRRAKERLDPLLGWLAFDGWGFHEGFFHWPKYIAGQPQPKRLTGYEKRAFDQGLGRSFWFVNGGNVELIAGSISDFASGRRADLWSGIGLAATYAGIVSEAELRSLRSKAGPHWPHLAQGAAFAAKARQHAGNLAGYTTIACKVLCGLDAVEAAHLTDASLENLPVVPNEPIYETWRRRIQTHFQGAEQLEAA